VLLQDEEKTEEFHMNDPLGLLLMYEARGTKEKRNIGNEMGVHTKLQTDSHALFLLGYAWHIVLMRLSKGMGSTA
jgi:hypothetical protein